MRNQLIFKVAGGAFTTFTIDPELTRYGSPVLLGPNVTMSVYLKAVPQSDRVSYPLDGGGFPGFDNAWCNFYCSGCYFPMQASRQYWFDTWGSIRSPYPRSELNSAHFRAYPPAASLPTSGECWHEWSSGQNCSAL